MTKEKSLRYGNRADLRDRILAVLEDGKQKHIRQISEEVNWPKTTSISKTLMDIKETLVINRDSRRLHRISFDNCRKGTIWYLTKKSEA